jgi:probable rRNA maturation factor
LSSLEPKVEITFEGVNTETFSSYDLENWFRLTIDEIRTSEGSVSIKFLGKEEMQLMNKKFRSADHPTNVLAFPIDNRLELETDSLGDIAICHEVVLKEAKEQNKKVSDHMAHIFIHGVLHLLGHDHQKEVQAETMENLERRILSKIGVADPY